MIDKSGREVHYLMVQKGFGRKSSTGINVAGMKGVRQSKLEAVVSFRDLYSDEHVTHQIVYEI
jgi:hypothetical protein